MPYPPYIELGEMIGNSAVRGFKPVAYYEKHLDRIRVELRDCSMTEVRVNELLTVFYDNYPDAIQDRNAGLMIKGVKHFFEEWGIPLEGVILVTELLNELLKRLPDDQENIKPVQLTAANIELTVDLSPDDDAGSRHLEAV